MLVHAFRYALTFCLLLFWLTASVAEADDSKEYQVKAAFLYKFINFVEWPDASAISRQSHIDICVMGESPINKMQSAFERASTPQLKLSLVKEESAENAASHCHILFIGHVSGSLDSVLSALKDKSVLTVSDLDDFAQRGGMVGFVTQEGNVRFIVNRSATDASHIRIDAQLLELALRVIGR